MSTIHRHGLLVLVSIAWATGAAAEIRDCATQASGLRICVGDEVGYIVQEQRGRGRGSPARTLDVLHIATVEHAIDKRVVLMPDSVEKKVDEVKLSLSCRETTVTTNTANYPLKREVPRKTSSISTERKCVGDRYNFFQPQVIEKIFSDGSVKLVNPSNGSN